MPPVTAPPAAGRSPAALLTGTRPRGAGAGRRGGVGRRAGVGRRPGVGQGGEGDQDGEVGAVTAEGGQLGAVQLSAAQLDQGVGAALARGASVVGTGAGGQGGERGLQRLPALGVEHAAHRDGAFEGGRHIDPPPLVRQLVRGDGGFGNQCISRVGDLPAQPGGVRPPGRVDQRRLGGRGEMLVDRRQLPTAPWWSPAGRGRSRSCRPRGCPPHPAGRPTGGTAPPGIGRPRATTGTPSAGRPRSRRRPRLTRPARRPAVTTRLRARRSAAASRRPGHPAPTPGASSGRSRRGWSPRRAGRTGRPR